MNPLRLLRSYIFWTYKRGSFHYDVMVTLILLFLFLAPRFIDFKDKPAAELPLQPTQVLVRHAGYTAGSDHLIYTVRAADLHGASGPAIQTAAMKIIQPISGPVTVERVSPVQDTNGHLIAFDVTVHR
ncbi:MAG TPA: hypothetical protein VM865_08385 [Acidobacteriaceae bacterium]|jgi:hypothetical protein|nr:hypothetical protein [Acidobacteriaceae bacterium]